MSNFNELIKQKVDQFEAPYNDAHWAEMEGKLDKIRSTKIKNNSLIAAGTIAVIAISSALYFNSSTEKSNTTVETASQIEINNNHTITNPVNNNTNNTTTNTETTNTIRNKNTPTTDFKNTKTVTAKKISTPKNNEVLIIKENNNTKTPAKKTSLSAEFIVFNNQICMGEEVSFEANEQADNASYFWEFGDGSTSDQQNPNHTYKESGKYDVTLTAIDKDTKKRTTHTESNAVTILPQPNAEFYYSETALHHDNNKLKYPYTTFKTKEVNTNNNYSWNFSNGKTSKLANPEIIFNKKNDFKVLLTVTNSYGCYKSSTQHIKIKNAYDLFAPNAFTPDNDGENDEFIPKALLGWDIQFEMTITDLSNNVLYKTTDKSEPWEGKLNNNGLVLPAGIYLWRVITYDAQGRNHQHVGKVNLLD